VACAALACRASTHPPAGVQAPAPALAVEPPRTGHADVNLTGTWTTGSSSEPAVNQIVLRPLCNYHPALWIIQQEGDSMRAWKIPESRDQGIASRQAVTSAPAEGWVSGVDVTIGTSGARYVLRYDSTSTHLRGTLNGAPFWAVRLEVVRPEGCLPPP
jgi:hypothetical protein